MMTQKWRIPDSSNSSLRFHFCQNSFTYFVPVRTVEKQVTRITHLSSYITCTKFE